jgi:hypothetical protein
MKTVRSSTGSRTISDSPEVSEPRSTPRRSWTIRPSLSSRQIDLGEKLRDYERAGVLEYLVYNPDELYWFARREDRFVRVAPDEDGCYRSEAFPGLWLDAQALLNDDLDRLIATVEQGLATAEHAAFVARLAESERREK